MNLIVCLDDRNGMMFNGRRLSRDRILREYLLELSGGKLWMNAFSAGQFEKKDGLEIREDFLESTPDGEFCFLENQPCQTFEDRIEQVILCKWNRTYPSDQKFDISLDDHGWNCISTEEFPGSSHEKITVEVYKR